MGFIVLRARRVGDREAKSAWVGWGKRDGRMLDSPIHMLLVWIRALNQSNRSNDSSPFPSIQTSVH